MNKKTRKRLIFLIDLQNCYLSAQYENTYIPNSSSVLNRIDKYLKEKTDEDVILMTVDTHQQLLMTDYLSIIEKRPTFQNKDGLPKSLLLPSMLEKKVYDAIFYKDSYGLSLLHLQYLKKTYKNPSEIYIAGVDTNICVVSIIIQLQNLFPKTPIILDTSLTAAKDDLLIPKTIELLKNLNIIVK